MSWTITKSARRAGFYNLRGPYDADVVRLAKEVVGAEWNSFSRRWEIPFDCVSLLLEKLNEIGRSTALAMPEWPVLEPGFPLHPFQLQAFKAFHHRGGGVLSFEMGLGKTPTAIAIGASLPGQKIVICPPGILQSWAEQLTRFGCHYRILQTAEADKQSPLYQDWLIVTYTRLAEISKLLSKPAVVIVDEAHHLKSFRTDLCKGVTSLRRTYIETPFLMMTGTLAADTIIDIYNPINLVWPRILGNFKKFRSHYFWLEHQSKGGREWDEVVGLHPLHGEELKRRLSQLVCQATELEQSHLLPPKTLEKVWVELQPVVGVASAPDDPEAYQKFLRAHAHRKALAAAKVAKEEAKIGRSALLMYHREGAREAMKHLPAYGWELLTGAMAPAARVKAIAEARAAGKNLVATMSCIKEGIDLTDWTRIVVGELPYYPATILQVLKRFHRLNSKGPVHYTVVCGKGTMDETIYAVVEAKINDTAAVMCAGGMADAVVGSGAVGQESLAALFGGEGELDDDR